MSRFANFPVTDTHRRRIATAIGGDAADMLVEKLDGTASAGTKTTGVTVKEQSAGKFHLTRIEFTNLVVAVTDTGGANGGYGTKTLYDLPQGLAVILGSVTDFDIVAAAGIGATAAVKHSLGTAAEATNDTLDSTQANLIASTSATLTASAGSTLGVSTAPVTVNGTVTPVDIILNFGVADAGISATSSVTITGFVEIAWLAVGTPEE